MSILRLVVNIRLTLFLPMKSCVTGLYVSHEHFFLNPNKIDPISNAFRMKGNCARKKCNRTEIALCFFFWKCTQTEREFRMFSFWDC